MFEVTMRLDVSTKQDAERMVYSMQDVLNIHSCTIEKEKEPEVMTLNEYKNAFIRRHSKSDWTVKTGGLDENGKYVKTYVFEDGAELTEVSDYVYEEHISEICTHGVTARFLNVVHLFRVECWNTDDSRSVFFYELV